MSKTLIRQAEEKMGVNYAREHGDATNQAYHSSAVAFTDFLTERYGMENLAQLKPHHIVSFFEKRLAEVADRTCARDATVIRDICESIGKKDICPRDNASLGISDKQQDRFQPKEANEENIQAVRDYLEARAERTGEDRDLANLAAFDLRVEFGCRVKESIMSRVTENAGLLRLEIQAGAKGGKWHASVADSPSKVKALEQAVHVAKVIGNKQGYLIPRDMSSKQMGKYVSNQVRQGGGTKANGANPHISRHAHIQNEIASGKSESDVSRNIGHGDLRELESYIASK